MQMVCKALNKSSTTICNDYKLFCVATELGDPGAITIAKMLEVNAYVTELFLHMNSIGYTGAAAIANAITVNTSVTKLLLGTPRDDAWPITHGNRRAGRARTAESRRGRNC